MWSSVLLATMESLRRNVRIACEVTAVMRKWESERIHAFQMFGVSWHEFIHFAGDDPKFDMGWANLTCT